MLEQFKGGEVGAGSRSRNANTNGKVLRHRRTAMGKSQAANHLNRPQGYVPTPGRVGVGENKDEFLAAKTGHQGRRVD